MREPPKETDAVAREVVDAALTVHTAIGPGYAESFYEAALCIELEARSIVYQRQIAIMLRYRERIIGTHRLDLIVGGVVVVELKTVECLAPVHVAQVISYLKSTGLQVGLLINFRVRELRSGLRRVVLSR